VDDNEVVSSDDELFPAVVVSFNVAFTGLKVVVSLSECNDVDASAAAVDELS